MCIEPLCRLNLRCSRTPFTTPPLLLLGPSQQDDAPGTGGKASATVDLSSVVGVGDSLPHDILGAQRAGISSVFVAGGVHFEELGVRQGAGDVPDDDACSVAFLKHLEGRGTPTHTVPAFRW